MSKYKDQEKIKLWHKRLEIEREKDRQELNNERKKIYNVKKRVKQLKEDKNGL